MVSGGTTACVAAGRLAEGDPSLKILVSLKKVRFISILLIPKPPRLWKLVHIPIMYQTIYSQRGFLGPSPTQIHFRIMWQNLVQLCLIVQQSLLQDGVWAVDLV